VLYQESEDVCCTKKKKRPPPAHPNARPVATNNFFAPLRDLPMENADTGSEGNSTERPGTNGSPGKGRTSPVVLTSEANLISLQRELKSVVSGEFLFRNTATGTRITTKSMVDYNAVQKFITE
jgi:hypothetical protein